jgi:hypothetical protein
MSSAITFGLDGTKDLDSFVTAGCFDSNGGSSRYGELSHLDKVMISID